MRTSRAPGLQLLQRLASRRPIGYRWYRECWLGLQCTQRDQKRHEANQVQPEEGPASKRHRHDGIEKHGNRNESGRPKVLAGTNRLRGRQEQHRMQTHIMILVTSFLLGFRFPSWGTPGERADLAAPTEKTPPP